MNTRSAPRSTSSMVLSAALVLAASLAAACGPTKYAVIGTDLVAGADGAVTADVKRDQGTTKLTVRVEHLAPPARVKPGKTTFVAWQRKDSQTTWNRIGGLEYDEGNRRGELAATVPETRFELIVTAEDAVSVVSPSPDVVMTQMVADSH